MYSYLIKLKDEKFYLKEESYQNALKKIINSSSLGQDFILMHALLVATNDPREEIR